ncbi:hypothetical protein ABZP36_034664 [Zizania latifolia]
MICSTSTNQIHSLGHCRRLTDPQPRAMPPAESAASGAVVPTAASWIRSLGQHRRPDPQSQDIGFGCIAVSCPDLRELSLKWCIWVTHLGLDLLALKCKKLKILDLSCVMSFVGHGDSINEIRTLALKQSLIISASKI